jgi:hypothetical protein
VNDGLRRFVKVVDARLRGHDGIWGWQRPRLSKVFWFFFSKKNRFAFLKP